VFVLFCQEPKTGADAGYDRDNTEATSSHRLCPRRKSPLRSCPLLQPLRPAYLSRAPSSRIRRPEMPTFASQGAPTTTMERRRRCGCRSSYLCGCVGRLCCGGSPNMYNLVWRGVIRCRQVGSRKSNKGIEQHHRSTSRFPAHPRAFGTRSACTIAILHL
jgi:hypothetical protein